jgi:hypothetical protein
MTPLQVTTWQSKRPKKQVGKRHQKVWTEYNLRPSRKTGQDTKPSQTGNTNSGWNDAWQPSNCDGLAHQGKDTHTGRRSSPNPHLSPTTLYGSQPQTPRKTSLAGKHDGHSTHDELPPLPYNWRSTMLSRAHTHKDSGPRIPLSRLHANAAPHSELPPTSLGNVHTFSNHALITGFIPTCVHSPLRSCTRQLNAHINFSVSSRKAKWHSAHPTSPFPHQFPQNLTK